MKIYYTATNSLNNTTSHSVTVTTLKYAIYKKCRHGAISLKQLNTQVCMYVCKYCRVGDAWPLTNVP